MNYFTLISIILMALVATSCSKPAPKAIGYGKDLCTSCKMGITDQKFGAELLTNTGKIHVFDSPECMIEWVKGGTVVESDIHSYWVTDFVNPGTLIEAKTAWYLESEMIHSPMGLNVAAFHDSVSCDAAHHSFVGTVRTFDEVTHLVND